MLQFIHTEVNKTGGGGGGGALDKQLIVEKTELSVLGDEGLNRMLDISTGYKTEKKSVCSGFLISLAITNHINNIVDMPQVNRFPHSCLVCSEMLLQGLQINGQIKFLMHNKSTSHSCSNPIGLIYTKNPDLY